VFPTYYALQVTDYLQQIVVRLTRNVKPVSPMNFPKIDDKTTFAILVIFQQKLYG
jgi:predicted ThiF/HesA family dinucleotide-utilizing enzyme